MESCSWMFASLLVAFTVARTTGEFTTVAYRNCGGEFGDVRVDPCPTLPCVLKRGSTFKVEADFVPDESHKTLRMKLIGNIGGVWLPLPGFRKNACRNNGLACPLETGKPYTLRSQLKIQPSYPKLDADVEWSMYGDNNKTIFCFQLPVKLTD